MKINNNISRYRKLFAALGCFSGGMLYAAALPPLNWSFAVFISLLPVLYCGCRFKWKFSAFCGWLWGIGWAFFSCNFLREIEWFVPILLAPVLALWQAVFADVGVMVIAVLNTLRTLKM